MTWVNDQKEVSRILDGGDVDVLLVLGETLADDVMSAIRYVRNSDESLPIVPVLAEVDAGNLEELHSAGVAAFLLLESLSESVFQATLDWAVRSHARSRQSQHLLDTLIQETDRLRRETRRDSLTGLHNRRGIEEAFRREAHRAVRSGIPCTILLLDVDKFKEVNDQIGHTAGDAVLRQVGVALQDSLRATDEIGRIGGDEFLILLPETKPGEALHIAERTRLRVSQEQIDLGHLGKGVTVSIGVAAIQGQETQDVETVLSQLHDALNRSKRMGRNRVCYAYDEQTQRKVMESNLGNILDQLCYQTDYRVARQSIVDLSIDSVQGYELFSRSSQDAFEMPTDFFRVCMEGKILTPVDLRCFQACLRHAASIDPQYRIHINLFPATLTDVGVGHVIRLIAGEGIRCQIVLELSEAYIVGEPGYLRAPIRELQSAGVKVCIDGVGVARSGMECVVVLEPDMVKLDLAALRQAGSMVVPERLLDRSLQIMKSLGVHTIVGKVEREQERALLVRHEVKEAQGFLWGEPEVATEPVRIER